MECRTTITIVLKTKFQNAIAFIAILMVFGCAASGQHTYKQPPEGSSAVIEPLFLRESTFVWTRFTLLTVDDRYIEVTKWTGFASEPIRVSPGLRRLNVTITFNHGVGNPPMTAVIPTEVNVVQGKTYQIKGRILGTNAEVWLEESGSRISVIARATLGTNAPAAPSVFVPVPM